MHNCIIYHLSADSFTDRHNLKAPVIDTQRVTNSPGRLALHGSCAEKLFVFMSNMNETLEIIASM